MEKSKSEWVHCNNCAGKKRHELLHHEDIRWSEHIDKEFTIKGGDIYDLLKCCGCDRVTLRHKSWHSEDYDHETDRPYIDIQYYPPPSFRKPPKWLSDLLFVCEFEDTIEGLIREIYIALQNDATKLAVMGIRALIETVMIDKVGDNGSFGNNINVFHQEGYISTKQREVLESLLEAGHATIHRVYKPDKKDVRRLMDIAENIIETIYMNEYRAKSVAEKVPARMKSKKKEKMTL